MLQESCPQCFPWLFLFFSNSSCSYYQNTHPPPNRKVPRHIFGFWKAHRMPVGVAVLYRYLLGKAVQTRKDFVQWLDIGLGKDMQKLLTDVYLAYLIWNRQCIETESRKISNLPPAPTSLLIAFLIIQY